MLSTWGPLFALGNRAKCVRGSSRLKVGCPSAGFAPIARVALRGRRSPVKFLARRRRRAMARPCRWYCC